MIGPRLFYGSFMLLALAVFVLVRHFVPRPAALAVLPWWKRLGLALAAFIGGSLGAKLAFAPRSPGDWLKLQAWISDGKTIMTGLIGAYLAVELAKYLMEVRVKTGDTFALPLALAMSVGRWGCFFNGCCYGTETTLPWGVSFYVPGEERYVVCHPTQIYESLFHFTMGLVLWQLMMRDLLPGQRLKLYLISYAVYRFLTEYIRPEPLWLMGLTFYQWAAVALAVGLTMQWLVERRRAVLTLVPKPGPS